VRTAGVGSELFSVRVDLFTDAENPNSLVSSCADGLCDLLGIPSGEWTRGEIGVDRGIGVEGDPVIGFLFWVRGGDVGEAAATALETARAAGKGFGVGPRYYDVSLVPEDAIVMPEEPFPSGWSTDRRAIGADLAS
jgi:hypothetical protein